MRFMHPTPVMLLVDDDPDILDLLARFVASSGADVQYANNGLEALDILGSMKIDIVFTDVMMPELGGMQLLAHIRRHYPQTAVIVVTGYDHKISYAEVIRAGASDYILKPFSRDEVEAKLNRVVRELTTIAELERLSRKDSLTGLYNRHWFDIKLSEEAHRAHRQGYKVLLAMADVDEFKSYNDTFGHQAGDNVLETIGRILIRCTRKDVDTCFGYGGDEFALIVPQSHALQLSRTAAQIVDTYARMRFGPTTLSVGISTFTRHQGKPWSEDIGDIIERADQAMCQAKADPEIHVVCAPDSP